MCNINCYKCLVVLFTTLVLSGGRLNHAKAETKLYISATALVQSFTLEPSGDKQIKFIFYGLRDTANGSCDGHCTVKDNKLEKNKKIDGCLVQYRTYRYEAEVVIKTDAFYGDWVCLLKTPDKTDPSQKVMQSPIFSIKDIDEKSRMPTTLPGSKVNVTTVVVPYLQSEKINLEAGEEKHLRVIAKLHEDPDTSECQMTCIKTDIKKGDQIVTKSCQITKKQAIGDLEPFTATQTHGGRWDCKIKKVEDGIMKNFNPEMVVTLNITVTEKPEILTQGQVITYAVIIICLLVIIIIWQTLCIIHYKKKAGGLVIPMSTRKTKHDDARDVPPPPPPLETLPVTPKPESRYVSHKKLDSKPMEGSRTTPRFLAPPQQNRRFNTIERSSSLERIRNRPQMPVPGSDDKIYEEMAQDSLPLLKARKHHLFGMSSASNLASVKPADNSPLLGQKRPSVPDKPRPKPGPNMDRPSHKPPMGVNMLLGGIPVSPSMLVAANLKPVNIRTQQIPSPPMVQRPLPPQAPNLSPPRNAQPYKKPPKPEPVPMEPEPIPEDFDSGSSNDDVDDEFSYYEALPQYRIYGNTLTEIR